MTAVSDYLKRRDVANYLARRYSLVWAPIWLTGGTSSDGRIVFLDPNLRDHPRLVARVVWHERVESALRNVLGMQYPEAHHLATQAERERYGPEDRVLKAIVARNLKVRSRRLPRGFDRSLARDAANSVGN